MITDGITLTVCEIELHIRSITGTFGAGSDSCPPQGGRVWTALTFYHNAGHQDWVVIGVYLWRFLISVHLR